MPLSEEEMKYRKLKPWKYQLTEPFTITLGFIPAEQILTEFIKIDRSTHWPEATLTLSKYYAWDGASGPCPDTPNVMKGSLVHDACYQLMRLGLLDRSYRKSADLELKRICIESGMSKFWAGLIYWGCRVFCGPAAWPKPKPPVYQIL